MNLYASVRDENGNIIIIRDSGYKTKREFKETLSMNGFKIRFVCIDDEDVIDHEAEKYEYKLQKARENAKYKREWLKTNHTESSENAEAVAEVENANEDIDYTLMSDNDLHDVVFSQLDYINCDLMETCVYNDLNGNGKYVHVSDNDFMDVTPALAEYNRRFGTTEIFCLIYRHFESRKTHVEYDSFDDTMHVVEVIPYDDDGNIIEYGYYVGDYYVRYSGVTENIEIVEANETETEITNETKNEKELKKAMKKTNREFKVNGTTYSVVNNTNYNKEFAFEQNSMKYYAMKLLTTDNTKKVWVKIGITGNTIDNVKEKIKETENSEKAENAISTDNNISELTKSVIELDKIKKSNNEISEKSREFLKEFNALSKDIITNAVNNTIKNTNKALLRIKINNLMCFTYLLTQSICKFLQNSNKVPNNTDGFIRYMRFNFLGIVFNIQVIDGKIIYVNFGCLSMIINNRCNYIAYDYVLDCYTYFSNIYYNIGRFIINAYRHIHSNTYRKITSQHSLLKMFCGSYAENHS